MAPKTESITIPKWFITVVLTIMGGAIPWAYSISMDLNTLGVRLESSLEVKKKFENHTLHHVSREEIDELKRRIVKLESK